MLLCMYVYSGPALASMYAPMRFAVYTVFVVIDHACLLRPPHQNFLDTALYYAQPQSTKIRDGTSMGFSVKKRDMYKLALFPLQKSTQKRGGKSGTAVFLTSKIGTLQLESMYVLTSY